MSIVKLERKMVADPNAAKVKDDLSLLIEQIMRKDWYAGPFITGVQFDSFSEMAKLHGISLGGKRYLDFGCGAHRPLSLVVPQVVV